MHPLERYLRAIREIRDLGARVAEMPYRPAASAPVSEAGATSGWSAAPEGSKPADTAAP